MKAVLNPMIESLSGSTFGKRSRQYVSRIPNRPGEVCFKNKPQPKGKNWKMPEGQQKGVKALMGAQAEASRRYNDPEWRAKYELEYREWMQNLNRHQETQYLLYGKSVRFLWDYVRISVQEELRNQTKESNHE